jgi:hypothetical protein
MASSAHAYVRGNTPKFYEWLAEADNRRVPEGPPVWICGDCHVGNLGPSPILTDRSIRPNQTPLKALLRTEGRSRGGGVQRVHWRLRLVGASACRPIGSPTLPIISC